MTAPEDDRPVGEVPPEVYGKPFHGWACTCDECVGADLAGRPRDGEAPRPDPYQALLTQLHEAREWRINAQITLDQDKAVMDRDADTIRLLSEGNAILRDREAALRAGVERLAAEWERGAPDRIVGMAVAADLRALLDGRGRP